MSNLIKVFIMPNIHERKAIIKEALKLFKADKKYLGMCHALRSASRSLYLERKNARYFNLDDSINGFPEILKHKPENCNNNFWFPSKEKQKRIDIFEAALIEINQEIKKQKKQNNGK